MQVHVDRAGERFGPYSLEEVNAYLANGTLLPTDQAWQDGMTDWVPISQIMGVTIAGGSPPPAAEATCPQCQAPVEVGQVICMGCGTQLQSETTTPKASKKKLLIGIGAGVGLLAIIAGIWFFFIREGESVFISEGESEAWVSDPSNPQNVLIEKRIREVLKKPEGELAKADLDKVKMLYLDNQKITDTGLKELAKLTQLTNLVLSRTKITDAGLKEVAKFTQLTALSLQITQITDVGLKELAKLKKLEQLHLSDTKVTKVGVTQLRKALPKCQFH